MTEKKDRQRLAAEAFDAKFQERMGLLKPYKDDAPIQVRMMHAALPHRFSFRDDLEYLTLWACHHAASHHPLFEAMSEFRSSVVPSDAGVDGEIRAVTLLPGARHLEHSVLEVTGRDWRYCHGAMRGLDMWIAAGMDQIRAWLHSTQFKLADRIAASNPYAGR